MIRITVTVCADDFKTANRLLKQTIDEGVDTIGASDGSSWVDVEDFSRYEKFNYSKLVQGVV